MVQPKWREKNIDEEKTENENMDKWNRASHTRTINEQRDDNVWSSVLFPVLEKTLVLWV